MIKLYADENFELPVVKRLREKGYDILTTRESGKDNQRIPDEDVYRACHQLSKITEAAR
jgi:type II secretory pathway component PulF